MFVGKKGSILGSSSFNCFISYKNPFPQLKYRH